MSATDEVRVTNAITGGEKGAKLARFDLIPAGPMWEVAELYGVGARKYADRNWERGYDWSLSLAALERHLNLLKQGEWVDAETAKPHLTSVVFHALALLEFKDTHPELCDIPNLADTVNEILCVERDEVTAETLGEAIKRVTSGIQGSQVVRNPNVSVTDTPHDFLIGLPLGPIAQERQEREHRRAQERLRGFTLSERGPLPIPKWADAPDIEGRDI